MTRDDLIRAAARQRDLGNVKQAQEIEAQIDSIEPCRRHAFKTVYVKGVLGVVMIKRCTRCGWER